MKFDKLILSVLFFLIACNVRAQSDLVKIDSIVEGIDYNIDTNKKLMRRIDEGGVLNKKRKKVGGWEANYYTYETKLMKVNAFTNYPKNITKEYYYSNDSLLYVVIKIEKYVGDYLKLLYRGKFYFHNGELIHVYETEKNKYSSSSLLNDAIDYLNDNSKYFKEWEELKSGKFK